MRTPKPLSPVLLAIARSQEGLLTTAQCEEHGLDAGRGAQLMRQRRLIRVTRGVYDTVLVPTRDRKGPEAYDHRRRRAALVGLLALGSRAIAVGQCALALHGVQGLPVDIPAEVTIEGASYRRRREGVVLRRYAQCDAVAVGGWRAARVDQALVQAVPDLGRRRALAVLDSARRLGLVDATTVAQAHEKARGRRDVEHTHDVWALADPRAESPLESVARLSCVDAEIPPDVLQLELFDGSGGFVARCDLAWWLGRDRWLIAEVDGASPHSRPEALYRDRVRQNQLLAGGVHLVRVTAADVWAGRLPALLLPFLRRAAWTPGRALPDGPAFLPSL